MKTNGPPPIQASSRPVIIEKELSHRIVGAFFQVYNELGFGFLESLYARALEIALKAQGVTVEREYPVAVQFQGQQIGFHRLDMLVEHRVIVEIKSTELLAEAAKRQLRSYVTATNLELGILLHFGPRAQFHRILGQRKAAGPRTNSS